uniref:Uncharacterized protein n=1 Tax=Anguilla anguilla TaxID=7936 RepID=A0A0E9V541_ANGAN
MQIKYRPQDVLRYDPITDTEDNLVGYCCKTIFSN